MNLSIEARIREVVTPEQIEAFQRDGAICLKGLLNADEIALLKSGIDRNLEHPSPRGKVASPANDPGSFFQDFCNWQENEAYERFIFESPVGQTAGLLMGCETARLYHDHLLVKEPKTQQRTPWHQDQPYYNVEGRQNCSMWISVDPVARASTLEFVAGSHLGPWLMPRSFKENQAKWFPEGTLADLPDIEAAREKYRILGWEIEPGDVVCFHMLTLHGAGGVAEDRRRRVFSVRFLGDDMRHAPRPWTTSPEFPGLVDRLPAGEPMNDSLFPVLWQKSA
ncbi:phytanoyl-CoA dioxygenase family protein [Pusillimonas sp. CC-YST705]|uniref:Phytanoyl-CoA dioxygenase family protein n=1 Tax=Mesopusillimonas faecipullorum TaxID=2755040 RepID=A0ABS8CDN8_9BURK|nr:phytanoyl-CoA dioxygenase family protein [Mesopusillimonas faecipullorum]MCB5364156.1 phytanoyl-CoA dioxygenase family protein [Mesopusillimonas faecipullorum]